MVGGKAGQEDTRLLGVKLQGCGGLWPGSARRAALSAGAAAALRRALSGRG